MSSEDRSYKLNKIDNWIEKNMKPTKGRCKTTTNSIRDVLRLSGGIEAGFQELNDIMDSKGYLSHHKNKIDRGWKAILKTPEERGIILKDGTEKSI